MEEMEHLSEEETRKLSKENKNLSKEEDENLSKKENKKLSKEKKKFNLKNFVREELKTLPLKIIILSFSGGAIAVIPFLVLQMQLLGITITEIAILYLIVPIAALLGPVVSGLLADKLGKYSLVFASNLILSVICFNMILIVPPIDKVTVSTRCNADGTVTISYDTCNECLLGLKNAMGTLTFKNCKPCLINATQNFEDECLEELVLNFECPVFNEEKKVFINVTKYELESSNTCDMKAVSISQQNLKYENVSTCGRKSVCGFQCEVIENLKECALTSGASKTFGLLLCIMFMGNFFMAAAFTMMDAAILQYVMQYQVDLGKQKIMSMIGFAFAPLLSGALIDFHSKKIGYTSYFPAFMLATSLFAVAIITILAMDLKVDVNKSNIIKDLGRLLKRIEVDAFLFISLLLGCNYGFIESYLFIYLKTLDAPNFLLGLTMTVGCLASIPMLFYADRFEEKVGRQNVFLICFTAYAARMFGYSFIQNPWMCLIFETFEAFTYQLMWVTLLRLCPILAPKGLIATMTGLIGAIHYSVGKGVGGFLGGFMIKSLGIRNAFRVFGGIALGCGFFYLILHSTFLKKKIEFRERLLKEEKEMSKQNEESPMLKDEKEKFPPTDLTNDLNRSLLAISGLGGHLSLEGSKWEEKDPLDDEKNVNNQHVKNNIRRRSLFSGSLPHLYVTDCYVISESLGSVVPSRSEGNVAL